MKMDQEVLQHAKAVSKWLREKQNPHVAIEITDSGIKMVSDEEFHPINLDV